MVSVPVTAGDRHSFTNTSAGKIIYSTSLGKASLKEGTNEPFTPSTVAAIASMSKLMTSVAVLRAVELGLLDLDQDVRPLLPDMGKHGVLKSFDDAANQAVLESDSTPISTRMLLTHTSGHEYDWFNPNLGKWRASRGEQPWTGPTVAHKSALPLVFPPGKGWAYGAGHDWAGKVVEVVSGTTLDAFMKEHLWKPLGIENDVSFYPKVNEAMNSRLASISTLNEKGEPPAVDAPEFDILFGGTDCLGGGGLFASSQGYFTFLSAVYRRDARVLTKSESYEELFRPQLDEAAEKAFNDYLVLSPIHTQFLGLQIPLPQTRMTWSLAGMTAKDAVPGRFEKGTTFWAGVPSCVWFMDHAAGVFGTAICQIIPPLHPAIVALHEQFQRGVLGMVKS
jgi:CubicO group peptidase (beta-lactamase class C family)